jgi:hypothetical protein
LEVISRLYYVLEIREGLERTASVAMAGNFLWELLRVGKMCWLQSETNSKYTHQENLTYDSILLGNTQMWLKFLISEKQSTVYYMTN